MGSNAPSYMDVLNLQNQVARQKSKVEAHGGKPSSGGPSILSRVFDVLSRGQYASAEAFHRTIQSYKHGDYFNAEGLKGFGSGLAGQDKTSFSDVLGKDLGVKNKLVRGVGGFVGDVALDPTTYIGAGLIKDVGEQAVKRAGVLAGTNLLGDAAKAGEIAHDANLAAKGTGVSNKVAKRIGRDAVRTAAEDVGKVAQHATADAGKGALQLKVMGRPVVTSERAYNAASKVLKPIAATKTAQTANELFRPVATFAHGLNPIKRIAETRGVIDYEKLAREAKGVAKGLTPEELARITHATEAGEKLVASDGSHLLGEKGGDLTAFQDFAKSRLAEHANVEVHQLGLDYPVNPNYVPHVYKADGPLAQKFKSAVKSYAKTGKTFAVGAEKAGFEKAKIIPTVLEAEKAGLAPETNMLELLMRREMKHQQLLSRARFVQDASDKFGVKVGSKEQAKFAADQGFKKLDSRFAPPNTFVHPDIHQALGKVAKVFDNEDASNQLLKKFDKVQNLWKTSATVLRPGHHFKHNIGNIYMNFLDGVTNPDVYRQAIDVMRGKGAIKVGEHSIPAEHVMGLFERQGLKSGAYTLDAGRNIKNVSGVARRVSQGEETWTRLAHFIDSMKKEGAGLKNDGAELMNRKAIAERAGTRVRKFNIDYGDLTHFESHVMKRVMPFYTFVRKSLPTQLEMLATRPGRVAAVPKAFHSIEAMLGTDKKPPGFWDTIPKWIKDSAPINVGQGHEPSFVIPPLPIDNLSKYTEGGAKGILSKVMSDVTPVARVPAELAMGKQFFSGAPIKSNLDYVAGQTPVTRLAAALANGDPKSAGLKQGKVANYLTSLGLQKVTGQRQLSELRRQQQPLKSMAHAYNQAHPQAKKGGRTSKSPLSTGRSPLRVK